MGLNEVGSAHAPLGQSDAEVILGRSEIPQGGTPVKRDRSGQVGSAAPALLQHQREIVFGARKALVGGLTVPTPCHGLVAHDPPPGLVRQPEVVLGLGHATLCGLPVPKDSLERIGFGSRTRGDHVAHVELGDRQPLVGGATVQFKRLGRVGRHAVPRLVKGREVEHGGRMAEADRPLVEAYRLGDVPGNTLAAQEDVRQSS